MLHTHTHTIKEITTFKSPVKYNRIADRERKWWKLIFANGFMTWRHFNETGVWTIVSQCLHDKSQQRAIRRFYSVERARTILFPKMIKMFFKRLQEKIDDLLQL